MPKRTDNTPVTDGFNFDGANTTTTEQDVTKILPFDDNKVDLGSPSKKFKNIYYSSLTPDPGTGYLKLDGSTPMQANLNLDSHDLTETAAVRIPVSSTKTVIGNSYTASGSDYTAQVGGTNTIDSSSVSAVQIGFGNDVKTSSSAAQIGNVNASTLSGNCVLIGSSNSATSAVGGIVIGDHSSSTATSAMCMGANLVNNTQSSLLLSTSTNIRTNNTTCDLGTTTNPFQNLYLSGAATIALGATAKNGPLSGAKYVQLESGTALSNSTTETSWFTGVGTSSGTRTYVAGYQNTGIYSRFTGYALMTMTGGGNLTFRFRLSSYATILGTLVFTPTSFTAQLVRYSVNMVFTGGGITRTCIEIAIPDQNMQTSYTTASNWLGANNNTIDCTVQFGTASANNTFQSLTGFLESSNDL